MMVRGTLRKIIRKHFPIGVGAITASGPHQGALACGPFVAFEPPIQPGQVDFGEVTSVGAPKIATVAHVGPPGAGHALKALNNFVSASGLLAVCEALGAAQRFGIDEASYEDHIEKMADDAVNAGSTTNNPVIPTIDEIKGIYRRIYPPGRS